MTRTAFIRLATGRATPHRSASTLLPASAPPESSRPIFRALINWAIFAAAAAGDRPSDRCLAVRVIVADYAVAVVDPACHPRLSRGRLPLPHPVSSCCWPALPMVRRCYIWGAVSPDRDTQRCSLIGRSSARGVSRNLIRADECIDR